MSSLMTSFPQKEGIMRIHNDFTLYFRVIPSGKRVVYYYAYDENGKRLYGKSTGETTLTAARVFCNKLLREGALVQKKNHAPTFAEYAKGWWEWDTCEYLKKRRKRSRITKGYADLAKWNVEKLLLPFFGQMRMDQITKNDVEAFLDSQQKKGYKNTTINGHFGTLKTMMIEALDRGVINRNPIEKMEKLINDRKEIRIITPEEFKKLFVRDWQIVWEDDRLAYTANLLAAVTGMRANEIVGLKGCYVYDENIYLCMQHDQYGYRPTKTKDKHNIPVPSAVIDALKELKKTNGDGFLFSTDGGAKPIDRHTVYRKFHKALTNIGMSEAEIAERKLHLHAWRHFFNTEMLKAGLTITQAQAVTGHKSERMTEMYCHFDPSEFAKAKQVQDALLQPENKKPEKEPDGAGKGDKVLAFPAKENELERKQA